MTLVDDAEQLAEARHAWIWELLADLDPPGSLEDLVTRPAWQALAACRGAGNEGLLPERGESLELAQAYRDRCPVRQPCLD